MASGRTVLSPVARRYALALVDLATENKLLPKIEKDLDALMRLISGSSDFASFIDSPSVSKGEQQAVLAEVAKKAKFQTMTAHFLGVVSQNGRLNELRCLITAAQQEMSARRGEMSVDVASAQILTAAQQKTLKEEVAKITGKDILLNATVNQDLIGGMVLTIGSQRIDSSVAGRLDRLKKAMSARVDINLNDNTEELAKKEA